jgi:hypothetical protein
MFNKGCLIKECDKMDPIDALTAAFGQLAPSWNIVQSLKTEHAQTE